MYRAAFGRQGFAAIGRQGMVRAEAFGREMGLTTWISIAGTDQEALAHGEVAATSAELQRILRTLSAKGIRLIAIRNHMTDDQHPFYFVGFWKEGRAVDLAMSLRRVIDIQAVSGSRALSGSR